MTARIAVLASGGGTNLQAILDHFAAQAEHRAGEVVLVASDRDRAGALQRAQSRGIATGIVQVRPGLAGHPIDDLLDQYRVDLIALAGYLRLVPEQTVERYRGRIVNVHPALLPAFGGAGMYGARVHQAVLGSGATVSGATVHFVDQAYDRGPIIAQWPVPVLRDDTAASLAARVLRVEHLLYPLALDAVAVGTISLGADGIVRRSPARARANATAPDDEWAFCLSPSPGPRLAIEIARALGN
jgi:formyltetrahydrofolate-dependent phosphoribosylglycinamide formyltransferase